MNRWKNLLNPLSIRNRLIAWFLLIALIPIGWTMIISYIACKQILFNQAIHHLQIATQRQKKLLEFYVEEKKLRASELLKNPIAMQKLIEFFTHDGQESPAYQQVLIVTQVADHFYVIHPSINVGNGKEIDSASPFGQFIQQVFTQSQLVTADIQFQNHEHLMVGTHVYLASNWGVVTIIDANELLKPILQLESLFLILGLITVFVVIFAASHVAQKIASPILTLIEKTNILAAGDLSQRIAITSQDEIGRLGHSFNMMASTLDHLIHHLDDLVAKRTEEYEIQNVKLEQTIKELRQTRDRLITQEKLASLGALTAGIAHEIKNPLNFIMNFAELSLQLEKEMEEQTNTLKSFLSEHQRKELEELFETLQLNISKILEHGKRADSIIFNMLQHSRGTPGEKRTIDLHKLLDEDITLSYHGMRAQHPSFQAAIEKNYDSAVSTISIVPQEMSRVILNLLNNAYYSVFKAKQSKPSSYQPQVKITTAKETGLIMIKIWDNGLGIASEFVPKLFTPFFTTKPPGEGTGLGLSLSYNIIVQGHGGTLTVKSQLGEFAEFTITLPHFE